jgi:hypothetical protein
MFVMEIVEGKDHPPQVVPRYSELGKTTGLMMRMLQNYFSTGWYVILDSGFCDLKALIQLKKVGMFACAVIKKRWYWPAFVPGETINREFNNMELKVGDSLVITGKLDGKEYFCWALKEPSPVIMKMMATGGPLLANDSCKEQKRKWIEGGFNSRARTTGITSTVTPSTTTTTCVMLSLRLSIPLPRLVGRCVCSPLYSR